MSTSMPSNVMPLPRNKEKGRQKPMPRAKDPRQGLFHRFARASARAAGHAFAFGLAAGVILAWAISGPLFHFNDSWQLTINTATTIVTFLMVFLIQNSQNRDAEAIQLKLDELLRSTETAHNAMLDIEELSEAELDKIKSRYARLAQKALREVRARKSDFGTPEVHD